MAIPMNEDGTPITSDEKADLNLESGDNINLDLDDDGDDEGNEEGKDSDTNLDLDKKDLNKDNNDGDGDDDGDDEGNEEGKDSDKDLTDEEKMQKKIEEDLANIETDDTISDEVKKAKLEQYLKKYKTPEELAYAKYISERNNTKLINKLKLTEDLAKSELFQTKTKLVQSNPTVLNEIVEKDGKEYADKIVSSLWGKDHNINTYDELIEWNNRQSLAQQEAEILQKGAENANLELDLDKYFTDEKYANEIDNNLRYTKEDLVKLADIQAQKIVLEKEKALSQEKSKTVIAETYDSFIKEKGIADDKEASQSFRELYEKFVDDTTISATKQKEMLDVIFDSFTVKNTEFNKKIVDKKKSIPGGISGGSSSRSINDTPNGGDIAKAKEYGMTLEEFREIKAKFPNATFLN